MRPSVTVDRSGRVVLPSEVRRRLKLRPGSRLLLTVSAQRIELTPEPGAQTELTLSPSRRRVLPAMGKSLDAVAATRVERVDLRGLS